MKETDALQCWCPFSDRRMKIGVVYRDGEDRCLGPKCMAWVSESPLGYAEYRTFPFEAGDFVGSNVTEDRLLKFFETSHLWLAEGFEHVDGSMTLFGHALKWGRGPVKQGRCGLVKP